MHHGPDEFLLVSGDVDHDAGGPPPIDDGRPTQSRSDLARIVAALRAHVGLVAATTAFAVVATLAVVRAEPPEYSANAVLRLADARRQLTSGIEDPEAAPERATSPLLSQIQLLRSRNLIGGVVDSLGLRLVPDVADLAPARLRAVHVDSAARADTIHLLFGDADVRARSHAGQAQAAYGAPLELGGVRFVLDGRPHARFSSWVVTEREEAIDDLLGTLDVSPRVSTNVVDVTFSATDPRVAQSVVNVVVESFRRQSARGAQQSSRRRRQFLESQLRRTDSLLQAAQLALNDFRHRTQSFRPADRIAATQREVTDLELQREMLLSERSTYTPLLARLRQPTRADWISGLNAVIAATPGGADPVIYPMYERLSRYQATRDSLTTGRFRRSATDPDVQRLDELITASKSQLSSAVESRMSALDARISAIGARRERRASSLGSVADLQAEEERLLQRVATIERMDNALRDEAQKARVSEAVEVGEVEIVDLASLPYEPESKLASVKLALGTMFGFGIGALLALLLELRNTTVRSREELEELLRVPSLGVIPSLARAAVPGGAHGAFFHNQVAFLQQLARGRGRALARAKSARAVPAHAGAPATNGAATNGAATRRLPPANMESMAYASEAFRMLGTSLLFSPEDVRRSSLVVTSAAPSEGKTTVAANLAIALARTGRRVLLVDCDLRRARLHQVFGVEPAPGVIEALHDIAPYPALLHRIGRPEFESDVIHATAHPGLELMPAGVGDADERALFGDAMPRLLGALTQRYDVVVLDAPPVLAVADALQLAGLSDGVLLVARAGHTQRRAARETMRRLRAVRARVVGAVLTDADQEQVFHGYYSAYARVATMR